MIAPTLPLGVLLSALLSLSVLAGPLFKATAYASEVSCVAMDEVAFAAQSRDLPIGGGR